MIVVRQIVEITVEGNPEISARMQSPGGEPAYPWLASSHVVAAASHQHDAQRELARRLRVLADAIDAMPVIENIFDGYAVPRQLP